MGSASDSRKIILASKASRLRWLVLAIIVGVAFSADFLLKRDIAKQVSGAWFDSCTQSISAARCARRVDSHHAGCFDLAYSSMMLTFGRDRWESFKLIDYEACMNRDEPTATTRSEAAEIIDI